jgi:lysophospholipase L1-like esterase
MNVAIASQDNDRPSDWLARQLMSTGYRLGVLNAGTIGDPAGEDASSASGTVVAGVDRMKHDVLQQAGVKAVVIYFGGIDLRYDCVPATNVEASLSNMVSQAQAAGVRVILATLPPSEYCTTSSANLLPSAINPYQGDLYPGPENPGSTQRRALNDWIRTTGAQFPGVVAIADFDKALAYPAHPDFMMPNFYTNDNFHPNGVGYGVQSSAIPLSSLLAPQ